MRKLAWCAIVLAGCSSGKAKQVRADAASPAMTAFEEAVARDISAKAHEVATVDCDGPPRDGGATCLVTLGGRTLSVTITTSGDTTAPQGWVLSDGSLRNDKMGQ